MRAPLVVLVLLAITAALLGWSLRTGNVEAPPPPVDGAASDIRGKQTPDTGPAARSDVSTNRNTEPVAKQPAAGGPLRAPEVAADLGRSPVTLTVRDLANGIAVRTFHWRFRSDGPELAGDGAEGRADLRLQAAARGELLVEAIGYAPFVRPQFEVPAATATPTALDVFLTPAVVAAGITLLVRDTALQPIANVRVDAYALTPESRAVAWQLGNSLWARRTGASDGRYALPTLAAGEYGIRVFATDAEGGLLPLLPYTRTFVLTGDNGYLEDAVLEPGCLPVLELVDAGGAYFDPARLGAVTLSLRIPGGPTVPRRWTVVSGTAAATAIDALPGVGPVWPAEAMPAGVWTLEVFVAGDPRVQRALMLRAGERQVERIVVP